MFFGGHMVLGGKVINRDIAWLCDDFADDGLLLIFVEMSVTHPDMNFLECVSTPLASHEAGRHAIVLDVGKLNILSKPLLKMFFDREARGEIER